MGQSLAAERRTHADSKLRDRRVIPRLSDSQLKVYVSQIHRICSAWIYLASAYIALLILLHATKGIAESSRSTLYGVVVIALTVCVFRFRSSARSFLENESQARLVALVERAFLLMFVLTVTLGIFGAVHLVLLW